MKHNLMVGICMVLGMALVSEARGWGFSKDTVYEWKAGGDTVFLVNTGADTLELGVIRVMDIDSSLWVDGRINYQLAENSPLLFHFYQETEQYRAYEFPEGQNRLPPTESAIFRNFTIGLLPVTSKRSDAFAGDTIKMGVRIVAESGVEDTLIVMGLFTPTSSLNSRAPLRKLDSPMFLNRDLRGRRVVPSENDQASER